MQNEEIIRYASVIALDSGGNVLVDTKGLYRVFFDFSVNVGSVAHECVILVYNLPEDAETRIKRGATKVRLVAGSEAKNGEIFVGELVDAIPVQHETVNYLQMTIIDGDSFSASHVSMTIGAGESLGRMIEKCVTQCSSPLEIGFISASAYRLKLPRGAVLFGSPVDVIKSVAKSLNAVFYVLKSRFYLIGADDDPPGVEIYVNQDSGLIGIPVSDQYYASFRHDIDSSLTLGRLVTFDPKDGGGHYRIMSISGTGDTKDGEWRLSITAIGQSGSGPNIKAATNNVWR